MNDFEKAYNKFHKTNNVKEWWRKNHLTVLRVILFPIYFASKIIDKIKEKQYKKNIWSEKRAKAFCDKYLPCICEKTEKGFWLFNNGYGFTCFKKVKRHRKDYRFARAYRYELFQYIKEIYEIEGYTKKVFDNDWNDWNCIEVEWTKNS